MKIRVFANSENLSKERGQDMLNFIVVENDKVKQDEIRRIINRVTFDLEKSINIKLFDRYNAELEKIISDNSEVKIYIMGVVLNGKVSGLEIAKKIRETDLENEIIFITDYYYMFEKVYRNVYKVYDFIEKGPDFKTRLTKSLETLINRNYNDKKFIYKTRNQDLDLHIKNILYIYRDTCDRKLIIKTHNNSYAINMNIKDIKEKLGSKFHQISRSCLVNSDFVESYNYLDGYVLLTNGEKVEYLAKSYREKDEIC